MPININPSDPGLEQAYQVQSGMVGNDPLSMILKAVQQAPQAVLGARRREGLSKFAQTGEIPEGMPVNSPMEALMLSKAKQAIEMDQPIDPGSADALEKKYGTRPTTWRHAMLLSQSLKQQPQSQQVMPPPEEEAALQRQAAKNPQNWPSDIFKSRGPQYRFLAHQAYLAEQNGTDYNPTTANAGYAGQKTASTASASLTYGGKAQKMARASQSAQEQFDLLQGLSDQFPRADIQLMNTPIIAIEAQKYPQATNWKIGVNAARFEYARALNGGDDPTEATLKEATRAIPETITPAQLPGAIQTMQTSLEGIKRGQMKAVSPSSVLNQLSQQSNATQQNMVPMLDSTGKSKLVPMANVGKAIQAGWKMRNGQ